MGSRENIRHHVRIHGAKGGRLVEGIEDPQHPFCLGVQWHPERRPRDPLSQGLFASLVEAARAAARAGSSARRSGA